MGIEKEPRFNGAVARGREVEILVDGRPPRAFEGETVAAALMASGRRASHHLAANGTARDYCGIGVCFDCVMTIDGRPSVRTCQTPGRDGIRIESQRGEGTWNLDAEASAKGGPTWDNGC